MAKKLFDDCGTRPGYAPFYAARAALYVNVDKQKELDDLRHAMALDKTQWRYVKNLILYYNSQNQIKESLNLAAEYYGRFPDNFVIGMLYAKSLLLNGQYRDADSLLQEVNILPYEGSTDGRQLYKEVQLTLALVEMKKGNHKNALNYISLARLWPDNLGSGKPYDEDIDERLEDWLAYQNYIHLKDETAALQMLDNIFSFNKGGNYFSSPNNLITAWALSKRGKPGQGEKFLQGRLKKNPDDVWTQWAINISKGKAYKLPEEKKANENYKVLNNWITEFLKK